MISISIITATYNAEDTLENCLESVSAQSIDAEHLIIDGASTDDTLQIIKQYENALANVISEPDKGIYHAMNKGLCAATGDIVGILNADDYYVSENVLEKVVEVFKDPEVDACYGDLVYVERKDTDRVVRFWRAGDFNPVKFYWGWMPPHPTFFVRRSVYKKFGLFNLELGSAADYEIMLRFLLKHGLKARYIPQVLVKMRRGGVSNAPLSNRLKANCMDRKAWEVNDLRPYPWTFLAKPIRKIGQWFVKG